MPRLDAQAIAEMVKMTEELLAAAGFTGVKIERAPMSESVMKAFREEDPDDAPDDAESFGEETRFHRVTTEQGSFGIWYEPYVTLELSGTGVDVRELLPRDAEAEEMPEGWSLIGLDEGIPEKLFIALTKRSREP